jgi:uncharacterized linocin/CFP29 family protein
MAATVAPMPAGLTPATIAPIPAGVIPATVTTNQGRDKVHWSQDVWDRIDRAVHDEVMRTRVAEQFLPIHLVIPRTTSVLADIITITSTDPTTQTLTVDEGATTRLNEYWVEFALTPQQMDHETGDINELGHSTAVTLATRAANILAQAEDLVIFQGQNAINDPNSLFKTTVRSRGVPADTGLLDLPLPGQSQPPLLPPVQVVPVQRLPNPTQPGSIYGENTFGAVTDAYSILQGKGHYGPYALVLQTTPYADTHAPLPTTLIMTADRIAPLMTAGFYGTGTLPSNLPTKVSFTGLLVSLGGNTMDLVVGLDATTAFMQQDTDGAYRFRVVERFALRLKDTTAVIRLEFQ